MKEKKLIFWKIASISSINGTFLALELETTLLLGAYQY
jgi:hypothetical protein